MYALSYWEVKVGDTSSRRWSKGGVSRRTFSTYASLCLAGISIKNSMRMILLWGCTLVCK